MPFSKDRTLSGPLLQDVRYIMPRNDDPNRPPIAHVFTGGPGARPAGDPVRTLRRGVLLLTLLIVFFVMLPSSVVRWTDWLWFKDLGYERVFVTQIVAQWILGATSGLVAFLILYVNARIAIRGAALDSVIGVGMRPEMRALSDAAARMANAVLTPVVALLSFFIAIGTAAAWRTALGFVYRQPFGSNDPVFGRDIGFYVFTLPFLEAAFSYATSVIGIAGLIAFLVYFARGQVRRSGRGLFVYPTPGLHLAIIVASLLVTAAARIHFTGIPSLLLMSHTPLFGASYVDLNVRLPMLHGLSVLALLCAAVVLWGAIGGRNLDSPPSPLRCTSVE